MQNLNYRTLWVIIASVAMAGCASGKKKAEPAPAPARKPVVTSVQPQSGKESTQQVQCTKEQDVRSVSVQAADGGGCDVHYEKLGQKNIVASAKNESKHCRDVYERIKKKLEDAGYGCK